MLLAGAIFVLTIVLVALLQIVGGDKLIIPFC
ncbi:tetracycline repressor protein TetR [Klebsiella pneumoniae]|nr:tetracycline repressor protein TetR [Klebsiella pneumoniae]